jgi:hypothetical protein
MKLPLMCQRGQRTHSSPQGAAELDGEGRSTELCLDNGPRRRMIPRGLDPSDHLALASTLESANSLMAGGFCSSSLVR